MPGASYANSIAQWVEPRSRYPKMRVQIPLEPTNFSLVYSNQMKIKYIFATKNNNIENIQGIVKSKEAQKKPKGL